jgi:uncharacterized protein (TIGR02466 family)
MEINHAFSTLVAFEKLELSNREDVIKFCYQEVENGPKPGVPQSGFFDLTDPVLEELLTKLTGCFNHLHKAVDLIDEGEQVVKEGWANINVSPAIGEAHCHPDRFFSAVYYPQVDENTCLTFLNPNPAHMHNVRPKHVKLDKLNPFTTPQYRVVPETDLLVVFPSYLWHYAMQAQGTNDRISMAFNSDMEIKNGL